MLRIGISSCFFHADPERAIFKGKTLLYLEESVAHWVSSDQVIAYLIPTHPEPFQYQKLVSDLDGLVLQGGSDVSPLSYGEEPFKPEWSGDRIRDQYETALVMEFIRQDKPVLGICRGAQLLNVALGGTLYQDISTQIPHAKIHRDWKIYDQLFHSIRFEPGSELERIYAGEKTARVNSIHHQAICKLGRDLKVEAVSESDGVIEAIRRVGNPFVYAIQWHPEFQDPIDKTLLDGEMILAEFLRHADERKK